MTEVSTIGLDLAKADAAGELVFRGRGGEGHACGDESALPYCLIEPIPFSDFAQVMGVQYKPLNNLLAPDETSVSSITYIMRIRDVGENIKMARSCKPQTTTPLSSRW